MSIFDEQEVVDNPNSGVVSETTTKTNADGTTETYTKKNATNNPKWRGENQDQQTPEEQRKFLKTLTPDTLKRKLLYLHEMNSAFQSQDNIKAQQAIDAKKYFNTHNDQASSNMDVYNSQLAANKEQSMFDGITLDEMDKQDAANNYYGNIGNTAERQLDMQQREDPDFFRDPLETSYFDGEPMRGRPQAINTEGMEREPLETSYFDGEPMMGYPQVINPEDDGSTFTQGIERDTDSFGNPMMDPNGISYFDSEDFESAQDRAVQNANYNQGIEFEDEKYKHKYKNKEEEDRAAFMGKYITNPETEGEKKSNSDLVWDNSSFGDKVIDVTSRGFLEAMSYVVPSEEFATGAYDFVTDPEWREEISDWAREEPLAAAAAVALAYKGRKVFKALPKKYQEAAAKFASSGRYEARLATQVTRIETAGANVKNLTQALKGFKKGTKPWIDANMKLTKAKQKLQAAKNVHKALKATKELNTGKLAKLGEKVSKSNAVGKIATGIKSTAPTLLAGAYVADSIFGDDEPKATQEESAEDAAAKKDTMSLRVSQALSNLEANEEGNAIAEAAQRDTNVAQQILNNQGRIQEEYGMDLARDLFTVAVSAMAGMDPMAVAGAMGDELMLDQKNSRAMQVQGLKDQTALRKESIKQNAAAQKESIKAKKASRDKVETDMTTMISQGGLKGGKLIQLKDEVLQALITADDLGMDYSQKGVQRALVAATERSLGKGGWFDSEDEDAARANIAGHFMGNMAILSADGGNLSKDGYALKNSSKADNGKYTNWLFTRHNKDEVRGAATNKFKEWKNIREGKGDSWMWYNNFTGWAVSNLKATGQL